MALTCRCGCGEPTKKNRVFVNKEHQLAWMLNGGAREMNQLLPDGVRRRGGVTSGIRAVISGRLREAGLKGAERSREIADNFRKRLQEDV